jgi:hypothetical protein
MREPGSEQIALMVHKDLGLVNQSPEGRGVNNAIPIALKVAARGSRGLSKATPAALLGMAGVGSQSGHANRLNNSMQ